MPTTTEVSEWVESEMSKAADQFGVFARETFLLYIKSAIDKAANRSPLEAIFFAAWLALELGFRHRYPGSPLFSLTPQLEVEVEEARYRLDFAVFFDRAAHPSIRVAVELDGHDFHERTREQVISRNARDRALQSAGWHVFHYAGSEVAASPLRCASEVIDYVCQRMVADRMAKA